MEKLQVLGIALIFMALVHAEVKKVTKTAKGNIADAERQQFNEWKIENNKTYATPEDEEKAAWNFIKIKRKTESFNHKSNETYSQSFDQSYADRDPQNLLKEKGGFKLPENMKYSTLSDDDDEEDFSTPKDDSAEASSISISLESTRQRMVVAALKEAPVGAKNSTKTTTLKTTVIKTTSTKTTTTRTKLTKTTRTTAPKTTRTKPQTTTKTKPTTTKKLVRLPSYVDHTRYMQEVHDQKDCGACYIFSSTALIEYDSRVNFKKNQVLSVQNVLDCINHENPCSGGWPGIPLDYIKENGVAEGGKGKYMYTGEPGKCSRDFPPVRNITNWCVYYLSGDEFELQKLVAKKPVIVGVSLTLNMMYYKRGVFHDQEECSEQIDHAVVVVGYGTDPTYGDYWIVRNSWGINWGMNGYGWFARNKDNHCGIANVAFTLC